MSRVLAAMSGGVDSSVAVALLQRVGHDVVGVTMRLWGGPSDTGCCSATEVADARRAAAQLGIEHHVFDFSEDFDRHVVDPYVADHAVGRTPNPCVECNRHLKFDALLRRADVLGFDAVATGHHARIIAGGRGGVWRIARGVDAAKDQSYVLHPVVDADLSRVLMPIGELTKDDVRAEATALGLRTASKPDSQDVCFITRADGRAAFLRERIELHPGEIVDEAGRSIGATDAVELVTIGQRKGLGLAGGDGRRFVLDVDVSARRVTVGPPEALVVDDLTLEATRWARDVDPASLLAGVTGGASDDREGCEVGMPGGGPVGGVPDGVADGVVFVQCSAHAPARPATIVGLSGVGSGAPAGVALRWAEPQRRVAPGQSVVLYDGDGIDATVLGGGLAI